MATAAGLDAVEFWGLNAYTVWYVWLLVVGVVLAVRRIGPPSDPRASNVGFLTVAPAG